MGVKLYEVIAYVFDGEVYCTDCEPDLRNDENAFPIFVGEEDTHTCNECGDIVGEF
jgi:hypothetical protein